MTKQEIRKALTAVKACLTSDHCRTSCPMFNSENCTIELKIAIDQIMEDLLNSAEHFSKDLPFALEDGAKLPTRGHAQDAGLDLYSRETKTIPLYGYEEFDTGVHVELPPGSCGLLVSKSGLNINRNLISTGLIDEGYSGSIKVKLYNLGDKDQRIPKGAKISQLLILPVMMMNPVLVEEVVGGDRGSDGFGSTGE